MWTFVCEKNGEKIRLPHAFIDGYDFGDRQLEGVMFKVKITARNTFHCTVTESSKDYFATLNEKRWLGSARHAAEHQDVFFETESGGAEVWIEDEQGNASPHLKNIPEPKPVMVGMSTIESILGIPPKGR